MKQETYQDLEIVYNPNDYLSDWVFHYNSLSEEWCAIPRDLYNQYWNDYNLKGILRSDRFETLLLLLHGTKGDISKIDEKFNIQHEL